MMLPTHWLLTVGFWLGNYIGFEKGFAPGLTGLRLFFSSSELVSSLPSWDHDR